MNTDREIHKPPAFAGRTIRKSIATLGVVGIIGGLLVAAPASAATPSVSFAQGQFLSGSLAGMNLSTLVELTPATAINNGSEPAEEVVDPLSASVLGSEPLALGAVRVSPDQVLETNTRGGALSQYAKADRSGVALGASGTVGQGGAIGPNASDPGSSLTLSFDSLLNASAKEAVADLKLEIQAIAAQASASATSASGDYYIDGATLSFTSPALADLTKTITNALGSVDSTLNGLNGKNGELGLALNSLLSSINPALNLTGAGTVSASVSVDLDAAVSDLLVAQYGGPGVTFNLATGLVTLDLEKLAGGSLNDRPVNTELLTTATVNSVVSTLSKNVDTLTDQILARVKVALENARVDIDADLNVLTEQAPLLKETCNYQDSSGNILSEALGKLLGTLVCTTTSTVLPKLQTSVAVDVHGTVAQVIAGTAPATATAKVLGVPVSVSTSRLLAPLGSILNTRLLGTGGVLAKVTQLLDGPLLAQANSGLLGANSVSSVLNDVLSITVNVQDTTAAPDAAANTVKSVFTQTALRVAVAAGATGGSGLTTLNLASGSVGNAMIDSSTPGGPVTDPDPGTPGGPGTDPGDTDGGTPSTTAGGPGSLAYTGVAFGGLIALLLALLAAGAWLMREGYGRKGSSAAI